MRSIAIPVLLFALSLQAQDMSSMDVQCRAEAKEIALKSYQACVATAKAARLDQIRREYQQKLTEIKKQYEAQLQELKSKAAPLPAAPAINSAPVPTTSSAAPAPSASTNPQLQRQSQPAPVKSLPAKSQTPDEMMVVMKPAAPSNKVPMSSVPPTRIESPDQEEGSLELVDPTAL